MKTIVLVLVLLTSVSTALAQKPNLSTSQGSKEILADFRVDPPTAALKIPVSTQRAVLAKLFRRYLTDESQCNPNFAGGNGDDNLKAARSAGQIVPAIVDMATGSFTAAGQVQTAYVISVSECNASHAENFGSKRVAIFSGPRLLLDVDADFRSNIVRKIDLNGDGIDELVMSTSDMHQGIVNETAGLIEFKTGRLRVVEDFGMVVEDSCASEMRGSSARASVVSYSSVLPGMMPKLKIENYIANCRNTKRWRFLSSGKMQE